MRKLSKVLSLCMVFAMSTALVGKPYSYATGSMNSVPGLSDEQAAKLVKEGFEKFKKHGAVCCILEGSGGSSIYGYDSANDVGILGESSDNYMSFSEFNFDKYDTEWLDFNKGVYYRGYIDEGGRICYEFEPASEEDSESDKKYYFGDLISAKEDSFPEAESYHCLGTYLEKGPGGHNALCYRIEVPESDTSLYVKDRQFLPQEIFIGVDDGEIYRIDEVWFSTEYLVTSYKEYSTHFSFPDRLKVPDEIREKARLASFYSVNMDGIVYESFLPDGSSETIFNVIYLSTNNKNKKIHIRSYITVADKKYRVSRIGDYAFEDEKKIEEVSTGDSITTIGERAFAGDTNLKKAVLGKKVSEIGKKAFKGCRALKTIVVKNKKMKKYLKTGKARKKLSLGKNVVIK